MHKYVRHTFKNEQYIIAYNTHLCVYIKYLSVYNT